MCWCCAWCLTSTWVSGVQMAVSGRRGCSQPGYAPAWRALGQLHPALETSDAAPRCGWLHSEEEPRSDYHSLLKEQPLFRFLTLTFTDLGEGERWYLAWCQEGRVASHPGLATGMEGYCFLGSLEGLGCPAQGSEGSFPPVWAATLKTVD